MPMVVLAAPNLSTAEVWMKTTLVTSDVRSFYPPLQPESAHSWHDPTLALDGTDHLRRDQGRL
jgi:hypothetical protein